MYEPGCSLPLGLPIQPCLPVYSAEPLILEESVLSCYRDARRKEGGNGLASASGGREPDSGPCSIDSLSTRTKGTTSQSDCLFFARETQASEAPEDSSRESVSPST